MNALTPVLVCEPDHVIVWGDVDRLAKGLSADLGLPVADAGVHPGAGSRNAVFAATGDTFLEVLGADPAQPPPSWGPVAEGLWWWAVRTRSPLEDVRARFEVCGVATGPVEAGERIRPSGNRLSWTVLDPLDDRFGNVLPFVIRWDDGPPLRTAGADAVVVALTVCHPDPDAVARVFDALGLAGGPAIERAERPGLRAQVEGPAGTRRFQSP